MKRAGRALLLIACCLSASAQAYWQSRNQSFVATSSYTGPGDIVSSAVLWYSCSWAYSSGDVANTCNVCLPSDTTCADLTVGANGRAVVPGSLSTCNITTVICTVKTLYDKGSLAKNITNATEANRPTFRPAMASNGCPTVNDPCLLYTAASAQTLFVTGVTFTQPFTGVVLLNKTGSTSAGPFGIGCCTLDFSTNTPVLNFGSNLIGTAITPGTDYVFQLVGNGASSEIYKNGASDIIGNAGANGPSGNTLNVGTDTFSSWNGTIGEIGFWPSAFNGTQEGNMNTNVKTTRWGF